MKRFIQLMSCLLLITLIVACGGKKEENSTTKSSDSAKAKEQLVIKMLYPDNSSYPYREEWLVLQEIEKATGVKLQLQAVPDAANDYEAKRQIVFNSGKIPEMVYSKQQAASEDVINGLLLPIDDYLDKMPNLKNFLAENDYKDDINNLREADGKFYTLPAKADTKRMRIHQWLVRVDIFEKHNIPLPKTLDDVFEAGKKLKEIYPDSTPITNRFGSGNIMGMLGSGFGTLAGWSLSTNGHIYDKASDTWEYAPITDEYKELLMYINKLIEKGVLDQEFTSLDSTAYEQKIIQGNQFIMADWVGNQVRYNLEGKKSDPDFNVQPIFPVTGPSGDYAVERGSLYEQFMILPASLKNHKRFDEVLAFIDWFYSEEAAVITTFGKEGVSYVKEDGKYRYKDLSIDFSKEWGLQNNSLNLRRHPDFFAAFNGDEIAGLFDKIAEANAVKPIDPKVRYSEDDIDALKLYVPPVNDYKNSMVESFIYGKVPFSEWDAFVTECKRKGSDKIGKVINEAWKKQNQ